MAGKAVDLKGVAFDPRKTTLGEFLQLYVEEGRKKGGKLKGWGNKVRNNPVFSKYLNEPIISIFDVGAEVSDAAGNLLADAQNAETTTGGKSSLQSEIRNIEDNVFPKIKAIAAKEKFDIGDFDTLSDKVERLKTRGNRVTNRYQFNPTKLGDLQEALVEHVKNNPADRPIANAILLNLETASRPSLMTGLLFTDHQENQVTPAAQLQGVKGSDGLFIEPSRQGAKDSTKSERPYRSPLSKRAVAIIQDQNQYNRTQPWANRADPNQVFQIEALDKNGKKIVRPIISKDVTDVLKQLDVPGLVLEFSPTGGLVESNKKITAQDLRKLGIQNMNTIGIPAKNQAMLLSRDIGDIAAQDIYIPGAIFSNPAVDDINKHSNFMLGLLTQKLSGGTEAVQAGKVLSPSTFIFDGLDTPTFEVYDEAQVADVPIRKPSIPKPTPVEIDKPDPIKEQVAKLEAQDVPDGPPSRDALEYTEAEKAQLKARGWKLPTAITAITAGSIATSSDSAKAASEVARDIALDTAAEQAGKLIVKRGLSRFIPGADLVIPSANMGMQTLQEGDQPATQEELDTARIQAAQAVKERDAARIQESAIPSQYPNTDNFLNMQP